MTTKITIQNLSTNNESNVHPIEIAEYNEVMGVFATKQVLQPGESTEKYLYPGLVLFVKENPVE